MPTTPPFPEGAPPLYTLVLPSLNATIVVPVLIIALAVIALSCLSSAMNRLQGRLVSTTDWLFRWKSHGLPVFLARREAGVGEVVGNLAKIPDGPKGGPSCQVEPGQASNLAETTDECIVNVMLAQRAAQASTFPWFTPDVRKAVAEADESMKKLDKQILAVGLSARWVKRVGSDEGYVWDGNPKLKQVTNEGEDKSQLAAGTVAVEMKSISVLRDPQNVVLGHEGRWSSYNIVAAVPRRQSPAGPSQF